MSRSRASNNVRGPTSALTEFLRASGITPTTVARRVATRADDHNDANSGGDDAGPVAGPSGAAQANGARDDAMDVDDAAAPSASASRRRGVKRASGYASDDLDDEGDENGESPAKRKKTAAQAKGRGKGKAKEKDVSQMTEEELAKAKAKAKSKAKAMRRGKKARDADDDDFEDDDEEDDDVYNALSKSIQNANSASSAMPPVGNFEKCAKCKKQFTVTKYTIAANPGPGFLCHDCAKASGTDPFKKPAAPRRRKPADKRNVTSHDERRFPTLISLCIQLIAKHIDDVEAFGDIGALNMEAICKALSKNRGLTQENAHLFYNATNTNLVLFDATNLPPPALTTLSYLNPNLTSLRLDFCGQLNDEAMNAFSTSLPALVRIELLGPFLVRAGAWQRFFESHPNLESFMITQSPRFDLDCMRKLVDSCGKTLKQLRLKEIGKLNDDFLELIRTIGKNRDTGVAPVEAGGGLMYLDLSDPATSCSEDALIRLVRMLPGSATTLKHLNLSSHTSLSDAFLDRALVNHTRALDTLVLSNLPDLSNSGVADFFKSWSSNPPLRALDLCRNYDLAEKAFAAVLAHSGEELEELSVNGWGQVSAKLLASVGMRCKKLRKLDAGWCREVDDFVVKAWLDGGERERKGSGGCEHLEEIKVWGCNRVTERCPRKFGVRIHGVESQTALRRVQEEL